MKQRYYDFSQNQLK